MTKNIRSKIKIEPKVRFNPDHQYVAKKTEEFLRRGGKITRLDPYLFDPILSDYECLDGKALHELQETFNKIFHMSLGVKLERQKEAKK